MSDLLAPEYTALAVADERKEPFNLKILDLNSTTVRFMNPVSSLEMFADSYTTSDFHDDGLFSVKIFGKVGSKDRDNTFSYINIKSNILHPIIYKSIERLKSFYIEILKGTAYAKWDQKTKSFIKSDATEGETGYAFFMSKFHELKFELGDSHLRKQRVTLLNNQRNLAELSRVLVLPAGYRDVEIDGNGRVKEHEINPLYKRLISLSNTVAEGKMANDPVYDRARLALQKTFIEIYDMLEGLISGKKGFYASKWMARNIINGTRNVATSTDPSVYDLEDADSPTMDNTIMGVWQVARGAFPVIASNLLRGIMSNIFIGDDQSARLIDKKTFKSEIVDISPTDFDKWNTLNGMERLINKLENIYGRNKPLMIENRYLALIYKPKGRNVFKVFHGIDEIPEGVDYKMEDVHPITLIELIYLSAYKLWNTFVTLNTRYPITGEGSTLASKIYVKTTVDSEIRVELDDNWEIKKPAVYNRAMSFPILEGDVSYVDSVKLSPFTIREAGGDYDGDMFSNNILMTMEAIKEIEDYMGTKEAYVNPAGGMRSSLNIDTTKFVMFNLTGDADE